MKLSYVGRRNVSNKFKGGLVKCTRCGKKQSDKREKRRTCIKCKAKWDTMTDFVHPYDYRGADERYTMEPGSSS